MVIFQLFGEREMEYPDNYIYYTLLFISGGLFGLFVHQFFLKEWLKIKEKKEKWKHR